jgi:hypothetical protein
MNALLRKAAGHGVDVPRRELDEPKVGSIGIGRGGGSAPARRKTTGDEVNARLRAGVRLARAVSVPGGVGVNLDAVDLDTLFGR